MEGLIKIEINENNEQIVSGRELHKFLEVKTKYADWMKRKILEYGFIENKDFIETNELSQNWEGSRMVKRERKDHLMKMSMAKEVSMTENNERGKQARIYFIKCEEAWNDDDMIMARALKIQQKKIIGYSERIELLENTIKEQAPAVAFANSLIVSKDCILVREMATLLNQNGIDIGEGRLFKYLRENGYLVSRKGSDWNMPTQKSMNLGLFVIKEGTRQSASEGVKITKTPKVTPKGQQYFLNKFLKNKEGVVS